MLIFAAALRTEAMRFVLMEHGHAAEERECNRECNFYQ